MHLMAVSYIEHHNLYTYFVNACALILGIPKRMNLISPLLLVCVFC